MYPVLGEGVKLTGNYCAILWDIRYCSGQRYACGVLRLPPGNLERTPKKMNPIETFQVQINQILGELVHAGSSMSSTIAYGMGMF